MTEERLPRTARISAGFLMLMLASPLAGQASNLRELPKAVLFDRGDPRQSVGIVGSSLLEVGGLYEQYEILGFEPEAILMQDLQTREGVKWKTGGEISGETLREARYLFIVKQLRAVFDAQQRYLAKYRDRFAPDLRTLIHEEFLADGFQSGQRKQGYRFRIAEAEKEFGKEPSFRALAVPGKRLGKDLIFSVDDLGLVRYADTEEQASWGPSWDYTPLERPASEYLGADPPS